MKNLQADCNRPIGIGDAYVQQWTGHPTADNDDDDEKSSIETKHVNNSIISINIKAVLFLV